VQVYASANIAVRASLRSALNGKRGGHRLKSNGERETKSRPPLGDLLFV
jgi:hypothetical protein